ncbi:MAG: rhodanese-like domain-containing protein [Proteobacteria bacterium]|nr:rhodanese-like domain-containing protein [Pseudomonadota bacterium]
MLKLVRTFLPLLSLALVAACSKGGDGAKPPAARGPGTQAGQARGSAAQAPKAVAPNPAAEFEKPPAQESKIGTLDVAGLAERIEAKSVAVFDVNGEDTRKKYGTIPTATLLSHYREYDLSELPAAKGQDLVFYCSNDECSASKSAAQRAVAAGYSQVNILPAGVAGWKKAGQRVTAYQGS